MEREDNKIASPLIIGIALLLWIVGLSNGTGLGAAYKVYERTMMVTMLFFVYNMLQGRFLKGDRVIVIMIMIILFQNIYLHLTRGNDYFEYLWLFLIPLIFSEVKITDMEVRIIGFMYGILGGIVLVVANFTNTFSGWDGNSVSIVAFLSYTVFAGAFSKIRNTKILTALMLYSAAYFLMLNTLRSRSAILLSIVLILCVFKIIPLKKILNKRIVILILLTPLLGAVFIVFIKNMTFVESFNQWSIETFNKTLFNGRDWIWELGFRVWKQNWFLGRGSLEGAWHNSAVTCLVGAGIVGYIIWLYIVCLSWNKAILWIDDDATLGLLAAFIAVWLQQSMEQGLVAPKGNPLMFAIWGMMLARVHTLEEYRKWDHNGYKSINNHTYI